MEAFLSIIVGILSIINLALLLALLIGLIKPSIILFKSNNPTRLKVGLYCIIGIIGIGSISEFIDSFRESLISDNDRIQSAKDYINDKDYEMARYQLNQVDSVDEISENLLSHIDSIQNAIDIKAREKIVAENKRKEKLEIKNLISQLEKEIESINNNIDFSTYRGTVDALHLELALFGAWAQVVQDGENSKDTKANQLASKLRSAIGRMQTKEFPILRKEYGKLVSKKMW